MAEHDDSRLSHNENNPNYDRPIFSVLFLNERIFIYQQITNKIYRFMPRMGVVEREETKSLILVCRARGYNHKQVLSVVNDNLRKYNNTLSDKGCSTSYRIQRMMPKIG